MKLCNEGIDNLRIAIVESAAADYLEYKKKLYKIDYGRKYHTIKRDNIEAKLNEVVEFFMSKWYRMLCSIDAKWLLAKLDKEFEEWAEEYRAKCDRKKKRGG